MNAQDIIVALLMVVVILMIIFLVFREVVCWYLKINRRIDQQEKMVNALLTMAKLATATHSCKWCGLVSAVNAHFCPGCEHDSAGLVKDDYLARYNPEPTDEIHQDQDRRDLKSKSGSM